MSKPMASVVERSVIVTRALGMQRARSGEEGVRSRRVTGAPRTCARWARLRPTSLDDATAVAPVVAAIAAAVNRGRAVRCMRGRLPGGLALGGEGRRRAPGLSLWA